MFMERSFGRVLGYVSDGLGRAERTMPQRIAVAVGIATHPWAIPQAALRKWFGARDRSGKGGALRLSRSIAINRGPDELYAYWRRLENLPRIMSHLKSVEVRDEQRSHWVARLPGGAELEWDAEITREAPDERLAWRSLPGSALTHSGSVEFKSLAGRHGTSVTVELCIEAQAPMHDSVAKLLGEWPEITLGNDLRRLKQLMETGEVATTEGQPSGKRSIVSRHLP